MSDEPSFPLAPAEFTGAARKVPLLRAFDWIAEGWAMFLGAPKAWLVLSVGLTLGFVVSGFALLYVGASFAPSLPRTLTQIVLAFGPVALLPLCVGAGLHLCRLLANGERPEIADLVAGFALAPRPLLTAGAIYVAGWLATFAVYATVKGPLALLLSTLAGFAFLIGIWFMPPLIALHRMPPTRALVCGFAACLRSTPAFAAFAFTMAILHLLAFLPAGLGVPILLPVVIGALHASYRDVFQES